MRKSLMLTVISLAFVCQVYAQDVTNFAQTAYDLTNTTPGGSARIQGLGGAQTALGGDISSAYSNPAGLGFFNRSEFTFSPNFNTINTDSRYLNTLESDGKLNFNFANLGIVINKSKSALTESKFRGGSFGISINRVASLHQPIAYSGNNSFFLDNNGEINYEVNDAPDFLESAYRNTDLTSGNVEFNTEEAALAYELGLIDVFSDANGSFIERNTYYTDNPNIPNNPDNRGYPLEDRPVFQRETIDQRGSIYQTSFSYGGNYDDRLYFGASVGFVSINREIERIYTEQHSQTDLRTLTLIHRSDVNGVGINASFGLIARVMDPLLIGINYATPTYQTLEQFEEISLSADFNDGEFFDRTFSYGPFNFDVTTPGKLRGGLTYFFGKNGFITADVERINFSGARLRNASDGFGFPDDNTIIRRDFNAVTNLRVGAEYRFDMFRVRGGYASSGDAISDNLDQQRQQVSFGGGVRTKKFYLDGAITQDLKPVESFVSPYDGGSLAIIETNQTQLTFTLGVFF